MAYIKLDEKKFKDWRRSAQMFQDDIVCAVGTDFMEKIAEAENAMIFDILSSLEIEATADVVEVKHGSWMEQRLLGEKAWDCSECKTLGSPQWKWCPICGAKMDIAENATTTERSEQNG